MTGWRAALRVARRSVRRHLGRSLLIIALIALPVAALTVVDGLVRTVSDRDVEVDRVMGTADAVVTDTHRGDSRFALVLPEGARAVPLGATYHTGSLRLAVGDRMVRTRLTPVELGDPLTAHLARLVSGRLPGNPREALVTRPLAERLGVLDGDGNLRPGATLRTTGGLAVAVTGLAVEPYCLRCADVVVRHDSVLKQAMLDGSPNPLGYLVDLPEGTDPDTLVGEGVTITTRESYVDGTPLSGYLLAAAGDPVALFAGLGLLGIVVTAGAAFAVGARRQVRELGLVVANGGTAKHVRRIVLAQGLVLGVLGSATGLVLGGAVTVLGVPLWEPMIDQLVEDLRFGWAELAGAAVVGVLTSVVAATVPAVNVGRTHPVDALSGRFRAGAPRAGLPLTGLFLVLAGMAAVAVAAGLARGKVAEHRDLLERYNAAPPLDQTLPVVVTLAGAVVTVFGLVLVMPALTAVVSRLGSRLPLSGRLAVRDALRHRHRTVAAGTAVMVTVAGSVVAAFVFATRADTEPRTLPDDTALARLDGVALRRAEANGAGQLDRVVTNVAVAVPGAEARKIPFVTADPNGVNSGPIFLEAAEPGPSCWTASAQLGVGTPEMIELVTGRQPDTRMRSALAEGKVVVLGPCLVNRDGLVSMSVNLPRPARVPAYAATPGPGTAGYLYLPTAFISTEAAAAHGWGTYADSVVVTYPGQDHLDAVRTAAEDAGTDLYVGEAAETEVTGLFFVLAGLAALVALLGAGVTVALSGADGRADLATLAALGAQPRRRRTLAGAHALVVTVVGTLAGVALGVCTGLAAVPVVGLSDLSVPWQHLLLTVLAVPLLASLLAALATPSRLPMIARQS